MGHSADRPRRAERDGPSSSDAHLSLPTTVVPTLLLAAWANHVTSTRAWHSVLDGSVTSALDNRTRQPCHACPAAREREVPGRILVQAASPLCARTFALSHYWFRLPTRPPRTHGTSPTRTHPHPVGCMRRGTARRPPAAGPEQAASEAGQQSASHCWSLHSRAPAVGAERAPRRRKNMGAAGRGDKRRRARW